MRLLLTLTFFLSFLVEGSTIPRCRSLVKQILKPTPKYAEIQRDTPKAFLVKKLSTEDHDDQIFSWLVRHTGFAPISLRKNDVLEKHKFHVAIPIDTDNGEDYRFVIEYSVKGAMKENEYTSVVKKQEAYISKYYFVDSKDNKINFDSLIAEGKLDSERLFIDGTEDGLSVTNIEKTLEKIRTRVTSFVRNEEEEKKYLSDAQMEFLKDLYFYNPKRGVSELSFYTSINEKVIKKYEDFMQQFYYTPDKSFKLNRDLEELQKLHNLTQVKSYYYKLRGLNFWAWLRNRGYRQAGNLAAFGLVIFYIDEIKTFITDISNKESSGKSDAKVSREFKVLLNTAEFEIEEDKLDYLVDKISIAASEHKGVIPRFTSRKFKYSDKDIEFFDTADGKLQRKGFYFRKRSKPDKKSGELTLKFRSASPVETLVVQDLFDSRFNDDKLEEDLYPIVDKNGVAHISGDFSYSASTKVKNKNLYLKKAKDLYRYYPQLKTFVDLDDNEKLVLVKDQRIIERNIKLGEIEINDSFADIELSTWEVYKKENGKEIKIETVSELSLKQRSDQGLLNFDSRSEIDEFLKSLSSELNDKLISVKNKSEAVRD